ncbi:MAG TPA: PaaX family transcriptional regulator C-terminal domain-containing protein [Solirubrobacteraceae bacterium]|nr:PaaX family transcriptional regulator C-terminal domain-containing protein [Solirubrobacteraceae bacterium]
MTGGEPLQPQDLVVTLLGTYVRPFGRTVWSGGLVMLLREFGFSDGAARAALTRLVRRGLIARVRAGRLVHYRLTARCERLLIEGDGRIFTLGRLPADLGPWTVLWHQIPEDRRLERTRLGRRLRFLGFGSVQDSVWMSPHDHSAEVVDLLGELGVADVATVFVARMGDGGAGLAALVARAWDLSGLEDRYEAFCSGFERYLSGGAQPISDREAFLVRTRLMHMFRGFAQLDPELPEELAALSGPRTRAAEIFEALYTGLAAASQRHFDAVTAAGRAPATAGT